MNMGRDGVRGPFGGTLKNIVFNFVVYYEVFIYIMYAILLL